MKQTYIDNTVDAATNLRAALDFSSRDGSLAEERGDLLKAALDKAQGDVKVGIASPASLRTVTINYYISDYNRTASRVGYLTNWIQFVSLADVDPAMNNLPYRYVR
jgi:hypothetical protein